MRTKRSLQMLALTSVCAVFLNSPGAIFGRALYVDDDAVGPRDGSSWATAFPYLQDALAVASATDEIRIAQGTYYPDDGAGVQEGDRLVSFYLPPGVLLQGGFAGPGTTDPNQRDPGRFASILSGDLAHDDPPVLFPQEVSRYDDNSCRVLVLEAGDANTVLDGLQISAAAYNSDDLGSGGLWIEKGSPRITHCSFVRNSSVGLWAAGGTPLIRDCWFYENPVGLFVCDQGVATVEQSWFSRNPTDISTVEGDVYVSASHFTNSGPGWGFGSAIDSLGGRIVLNDCMFDNQIGTHGACINGDHYVLEANRCLFAGNRAGVAGGSLYLADNVTATITNCVFVGNQAGQRGGAVAALAHGSTRITNSIFWDNEARQGPQLYLEHGSLQVQYCDIQGGQADVYLGHDEGLSILEWGAGNIDCDPGFADAGYFARIGFAVGDYHLRSQTGRWQPRTQDWVRDLSTSPCIDAGDPLNEVGEELPPNGGIINMGIYGGTAEASKSLSPVPSGSGWPH
jgi:hypothetical protein